MAYMNALDKTSLGIYGNIQVQLFEDGNGNVSSIHLEEPMHNRSVGVDLKDLIPKESYGQIKWIVRNLANRLGTTNQNEGGYMARDGSITRTKKKGVEEVDIVSGKRVQESPTFSRLSPEIKEAKPAAPPDYGLPKKETRKKQEQPLKKSPKEAYLLALGRSYR